jgi:nucleoside triphosphate pyrophosphatase
LHLILASASPRRAELLATAGFTFDVQPAEVDETPLPGEEPRTYVLRIARAKATASAERCRKSGTAVLAADTVVVADGWLMGKPLDAGEAERMLKRLAGAVHDVHTAVVVQADARQLTDVVTTRVRLLPLTADEIAWYLATGEWEGKAGGYAIQGRAARFIDRIEGSWSNVVGLPVATAYQLLTALRR